jgi:anthranilate phosphoribosyltransferase
MKAVDDKRLGRTHKSRCRRYRALNYILNGEREKVARPDFEWLVRNGLAWVSVDDGCKATEEGRALALAAIAERNRHNSGS